MEFNNTTMISGNNISDAWCKAYNMVYKHTHGEISPLLVSFPILGVDTIESDPIYQIVNEELQKNNQNSIHTTANTIFPVSLWNPKRERLFLYERYNKNLIHIRKDPANRRGIYFERLISYGSSETKVNQLEHIITTWLDGNHRRSALQAQIFDPYHDHVNSRMLGFPCLDQIIFSPMGGESDNGLKVTGVYAMQYIFEKAFGNYLGLARLGKFMAHEMKMVLKEVTCIACTVKLGNQSKRNLSILTSKLNRL
jgi:hypothetical protein